MSLTSGSDRRIRGRLMILAAAFVVGARHPMHTAMVELTYDHPSRSAAIRIRVFADDFGVAVPAPAGTPAADSATAHYIRRTLVLSDGAGRPVLLRWVSAERTADVVLLHLSAAVPGGLAGTRVQSTLLCDRFEDQVNIVRASYGNRTTTLLFTRGDPPKTLP